MFPRRSPRLVKKVLEAKMHNVECELSNASDAGCCYKQDLRPKSYSPSGSKDLPIIADSKTYIDGFGYTTVGSVCYMGYCPSCQTYWSQRVVGETKAVQKTMGDWADL